MPQTVLEKKIEEYRDSGRLDDQGYKTLMQLISTKDPDNIARGLASLYQQMHGKDDTYNTFVSQAQKNGDWFYHEQNLEKVGEDLDKILKTVSEESGKGYFDIADQIDQENDADLYAAFVLNIPEVREKIKSKIGSYDNLYRVSRSIIQRKKKKNKKKSKHKQDKEDQEEAFPQTTLDILKLLPENFFDVLESSGEGPGEGSGKYSGEEKSYESQVQQDQYEDVKRLFTILKEKAQRDCFRLFREEDPEVGIKKLESFVEQQTDSNIYFLYEDQLKTFHKYLEFQNELLEEGYINENFEHPVTGETNVLPSFHQTVGIYHNLEKKRFGVFDDCGTGKTAIAALLKPLIKKKKEAEGKKFYNRTIVIGPKASDKAW